MIQREEVRAWLTELATHPLTYGFGSAFARWWIGDRVGGWRGFVGYLSASLLVAAGTVLYLSDKGIGVGMVGFYVILLAFVGRDILTALINLAVQFQADPIGIFLRVRQALRGGPLPPEGDAK